MPRGLVDVGGRSLERKPEPLRDRIGGETAGKIGASRSHPAPASVRLACHPTADDGLRPDPGRLLPRVRGGIHGRARGRRGPISDVFIGVTPFSVIFLLLVAFTAIPRLLALWRGQLDPRASGLLPSQRTIAGTRVPPSNKYIF